MIKAKSLNKNSFIFILYTTGKNEQHIKRSYTDQRTRDLAKRGLRIKQKLKLIKRGASRSQLSPKTKHLDRKVRHCYPRGKAWLKVYENSWDAMLDMDLI